MSKAHRLKKQKNGTCIYSGKSTSGKEVLLPEFAIEHLKKQGYIIIGNPFGRNENFEQQA